MSFFSKRNFNMAPQTISHPPMVPMTMTASVSRDLQKVHALRDAQRRPQDVIPTLSELGYNNVCAVNVTPAEEVVEEIEKVMMTAALSIIAGEGYTYTVPTRASSNQIYIPELDRLVLADKVSKRPFANIGKNVLFEFEFEFEILKY